MIGSVRIPLTIWNSLQLSLVAGLTCAGMSLALYQRSGTDAPLAAARAASRTLAAAIEQGLADAERDARSAGLIVKDLEPVLSEADRGTMLRRWLGLHPAYADAWLVGADGRVRLAAASGVGRDLSGQSWFRRARTAETAVSTEDGNVSIVVALADGVRLVLRAGPDWLAGLDARARTGPTGHGPAEGDGLSVSVAGADGQLLLGQAPPRPLPSGRIEATAQTAAGRDLANPGWSVTAVATDTPASLPDRRTWLLVLATMLAGGALGGAVAAPTARRLRRLTFPDAGSAAVPSPIAEIDALERRAEEGVPWHERGLDEARSSLGRERARLATFEALSGWRLWEIDQQTHRVIWSDAVRDAPSAGDRSIDLADLVAGIAPDDRAAMRLTMQAALQADGPHDVTLRTGPAAPERRLLVRFRRAGGEDSPRLFALSREVADGDKVEPAERRRHHVLRRVTDGIVHDFNDVLTVILVNLDGLRRRHALDPAPARLVDAALAGAERGAALTRRMVGLVRSETHDLREADLTATVRAFLPFLQAQVLGEMPVMNRLSPDLLPVLCGEQVIEVAMLNLAFYFRDAGFDGFALAAGEEMGEGAGGHVPGVRLVIASGRPAPSPAQLEAPAYLEIVAKLVEPAGGRLSIASDGTGALPFLATLWLPAGARERAASAPAVEVRLRLLLVESDSLVRSSLAGALADLGHAVVQAASGGHALEILARPERFDAMIADLSMPAMSGLQLAATVVERHPGVQVIIAGPHGQLPDSARRFLNLDKPFRPDDLAAVLAKLGPTFACAA